MKKLTALMMIFTFALVAVAIAAPEDEAKGAADQALKNANENAVFNRIPDWFSTIGKSAEEKEAILKEKAEKRNLKKAEKEARKAQKEAEKAARAKEKEAQEAMENVKGDAEKAAGEAKTGISNFINKFKRNK